jgi:hypothetical protein
VACADEVFDDRKSEKSCSARDENTHRNLLWAGGPAIVIPQDFGRRIVKYYSSIFTCRVRQPLNFRVAAPSRFLKGLVLDPARVPLKKSTLYFF